MTAADRASHLAGLGFDAAIWEVWPYLTAGASVTLVDETVRTSPDLLRRFIIDEKINVAFVPTALAEPMIAADWPADTALRFLLTGADTLHGRPRATLPFSLINNYGPTECTVVATSGPIDAAVGQRRSFRRSACRSPTPKSICSTKTVRRWRPAKSAKSISAAPASAAATAIATR